MRGSAFFVYAQIEKISDSTCVVDGVPTLKCLEIVFQNILVLSSGLVAIILFIMFVVGSFQYLISGGDAEKVQKARGTLKYALLGTALFLGSYLVLNAIQLLLGLENPLIEFKIPGDTP
ncbi:hypothetical protein A3F34_02405 [Candidatus Roizmanbacteria bacterium RIFCSPHIGHO2_12_FULL_44_10]|uniref:Uncharacterized protein n=1 Tax=Candidatus Roizmanbacteria bacterium RIFCSPHIGHO2_12_FULL_44_10 TaxID=1802054 RepID=A0A1F7I9F6_9BACT|nr:MAG: hypothetical protein A3F34_02405 [Candidatus Roizmanbacteria bacterium RIFCSPHIGHO2_12_FULL_44_10]